MAAVGKIEKWQRKELSTKTVPNMSKNVESSCNESENVPWKIESTENLLNNFIRKRSPHISNKSTDRSIDHNGKRKRSRTVKKNL